MTPSTVAENLMADAKIGTTFSPTDAMELMMVAQDEAAFKTKALALMAKDIPMKVRVALEEVTGERVEEDKEKSAHRFVRQALGSEGLEYPDDPRDHEDNETVKDGEELDFGGDEGDGAFETDGQELDFGDETPEEKTETGRARVARAVFESFQRCAIAAGQHSAVGPLFAEVDKSIAAKSIIPLASVLEKQAHTLGQIVPRMQEDEHLVEALDKIEGEDDLIAVVKTLVADARNALAKGHSPAAVLAGCLAMIQLTT